MLIIFEGADKTGKTTLLRKLLKESNYKHIVYDRGPISQLAFDILFNRNSDENLTTVINELNRLKNLVVLCKCDSDIIKQRLIDAGEKLPKELENIERVQYVFEHISLMSGFNVLKLDTGENDLDECLDIIFKEIERIENDRSL